MTLNTEPERLTREVFATCGVYDVLLGIRPEGPLHPVTFTASSRCQAHGYFISGELPCVACQKGHTARQWADVQCLDCGTLLLNVDLSAQACPLCDGRVRDLA